jgi:hypothetical protein
MEDLRILSFEISQKVNENHLGTITAGKNNFNIESTLDKETGAFDTIFEF